MKRIHVKDIENREKGKYKEDYSKIINGTKVQITEETTVGRDFEILGFNRSYNPPVPHKGK